MRSVDNAGISRAAAFGAAVSQANGGERRFDRVGRSQVRPVPGREVVEREQHVAVLSQTLARRRALGVVLHQEVVEGVVRGLASDRLPDVVQVALGPGVHAVRRARRQALHGAACSARFDQPRRLGTPDRRFIDGRYTDSDELRC